MLMERALGLLRTTSHAEATAIIQHLAVSSERLDALLVLSKSIFEASSRVNERTSSSSSSSSGSAGMYPVGYNGVNIQSPS